MDGNAGLSVCWSTALVPTEISQQQQQQPYLQNEIPPHKPQLYYAFSAP